MSRILRTASNPNGVLNTYTNVLNLASFGFSPSNSAASNTSALSSFDSTYSGLSGSTYLQINPGTYNCTSWNLASTGGNGRQLTVAGYGVTITSNPGNANTFANPTGPYNDFSHNAKFTTTSAGNNTITLVTSGQTSLFTAGKWVLVTGIDMQGYGFPNNPGFFEFKKIQSIGSGTLTFTEPLINSYKDTWPSYNTGSGFQIDMGGPGNVYVLRDSWDQEITIKGITFTDTSNLCYCSTRIATWIDCNFATYGPCPSMNYLFRSTRCVGAGTGGLEVDKCVHRMEFVDTMHRAVDMQSASVNEVFVQNMTQSPSPRWRGLGQRSNTFINLNTGEFDFAVMNYGAVGPTTMTNCSATTGTFFVQTTPFSDMTEEGGGVLSYAGGPGSTNAPSHYWAIPGGNAVLLDSSNNWARSFQISDVTQSGGRTYVTTNLPFPVPSTINGRTSPWKIMTHPCPSVTMTNCTGNTLFTTHSGLPAGTPFNQWTL